MTAQQIHDRILFSLPGSVVEVADLTGGEDHYQVTIRSAAFVGLPRIKQHQLIMKLFDSELQTGEIHALSLRTQTP